VVVVSHIPSLNSHDALIVVDVQKDFQPGGALPVDGGDQIVPVLNRWLAAARQGGAVVVASRDWHPPEHASFHEQGGPWPVHCVQNTPGAAFDPDLQLPADAWIVSKGSEADRDQYSALDETRLARRLHDQAVHRVWIGGLALDVCVRATTLDALKAGFETHLILPAARAVVPDDAQEVVAELRSAGAIIEEATDA
jgi:nicotinamidase/pyrazinamidase